MQKIIEDDKIIIYKEQYMYTIQSKRKIIINDQNHKGNSLSIFININDVINLNLLSLPQEIKRKILDILYTQDLKKYFK